MFTYYNPKTHSIIRSTFKINVPGFTEVSETVMNFYEGNDDYEFNNVAYENVLYVRNVMGFVPASRDQLLNKQFRQYFTEKIISGKANNKPNYHR
ncbi:hypothetical protein STW0522ENT62_14400 [Enterobacter kobei]|nr:hypothetical protein STW0522ENT62_14400 [Enterobacter kobei]